MNAFDSRWKDLSRHAQAGRTALPEEVPFGFTGRVLAHAREPATASTEDLWLRLSVRSVVAVTSLLLILGVAEWRNARPSSLLESGVENTVAQLLGAL